MAIRNPPRAAGIVGVLLCALAARAAPAQRDFVFRHENVLGTSLELCIRADSEEAAGSAEARVLAEIDRLAAVRKGSDDTNLIDTISRATRPPGKYTVTWDGKDDHGRPLGQGTYTVCIEAAREHGTYQIIRKEVTIADKPFAEELKGNVEIKSASVEYRRKGAGR